VFGIGIRFVWKNGRAYRRAAEIRRGTQRSARRRIGGRRIWGWRWVGCRFRPQSGGSFEGQGFAELEDAAEGAVVHPVEAGFVAVEEGEVLKDRGDGGEVGGIEDFGHGFGFESPGAAHAPVGGAHLFDHGEFDSVDVTEAREVLIDEVLKAFFGFAGKEECRSEEAVLAGVLRGSLFAFGSYRPPGAAAVSTCRLDFSLRTHNAVTR